MEDHCNRLRILRELAVARKGLTTFSTGNSTWDMLHVSGTVLSFEYTLPTKSVNKYYTIRSSGGLWIRYPDPEEVQFIRKSWL